MGTVDQEQGERMLRETKPVACLRCKYFEKYQGAAPVRTAVGTIRFEMYGKCRRFPPSVANPDDGEPEQPTVNFDDWCGEFGEAVDDRGVQYVCDLD